MCEVFFFGTARRTDSHISDISDGIGITTAGSSEVWHLSSMGLRMGVPNKAPCAMGKNARRKDVVGAARIAIVNVRRERTDGLVVYSPASGIEAGNNDNRRSQSHVSRVGLIEN